jgi:hypothetical protein
MRPSVLTPLGVPGVLGAKTPRSTRTVGVIRARFAHMVRAMIAMIAMIPPLASLVRNPCGSPARAICEGHEGAVGGVKDAVLDAVQ